MSQQVLELTEEVVRLIAAPLSKMAATASQASLDQLARMRGIKLSSALLAHSTAAGSAAGDADRYARCAQAGL